MISGLKWRAYLKSWAVPKGPSLNPKDKRLAMMVEDHPYDYKDFAGVIPQGYGAGIVEIWDKGNYTGVDEKGNVINEKQLLSALKKGSIKFALNGKKLKGEFALVKLKNSDSGDPWLLIKHRDEFAVDTNYDSEKETDINSPINRSLANKKQSPTRSSVSKTTATKKEKIASPQKNKNAAEGDQLKFGKIVVKLTNRDKIYWPKEGITKGMMIDYYQSIAEYILPYLKDRPQSLKRNPNGITESFFYHKDAGVGAPEWVKSFKVYSDSSNKDIDYIICNDSATLAYLNNLGCIELNPWHSTIKKPDNPDYLIIDLDPSDKNTFNQVIDAANNFKEVIDKAGAKCFCKTSGASGLHIYLPMGKKYSYDQVKDFAHLLCMIVNNNLPSFTTLERNLKKRGNKMIYLDHLQNRRSQTIASVFSLRPKEGATVSMPLDWKELKHGLKPTDFTIYNALKEIPKRAKLFKDVLGPAVNIDKCLKALHTAY